MRSIPFLPANFPRFSLLMLAAMAAAPGAAPAPAPPLLRPEEAVRIGVENNYGLSLARDESRVAENNRKAGIGPFLPDLNAGASHAGVFGRDETRTSLTASAGLLLFDGFQSYHAYQRLKSQERSAGLEQRQALEDALEGILAGYYAIAQQKSRLDAIRELLAVSEERARLAQARMEVGAGSRLEQLQAVSDLNADSASFLSQQVALRDAKLRLNLLLAREPALDFDVLDTIPLEAALPVEAWRGALGERNTAILLAREGRRAARSGLKEAKGAYWPDLNASMRYTNTADGTAIDDLTLRDDGVSYTVSLTVPIFDQFRRNRDVSNAKLGLRSNDTRLKQQELTTAGEFAQALERHSISSHQVALEERNLEVSRLQAEAARERYKLGASSPLEFRDAQTRLLDSQSRLASSRQEAKTAELALKRLAGMLVREVPAGAADAQGASGSADPAGAKQPGADGKD